MKHKSYLWFIMLLATFLITATTPFKTHSQTETRIYLEPSNIIYYTNTTSIGHLFNVTVICENVTVDLGGAQIYMEFNDSIINATRWWYVPEAEGGFMPEPVTALPTPPNPGYVHIGPGKGRIQVAVSKGGLPPTAPWGHDGKIAIIEFNVTAVPTDGALTTALTINHTDTYLLDTSATEVPDVVKEDGAYTIIYVLKPTVPSIWLEVSPNTYEALKLRPFNVSIVVKNVTQDLGLIGIQFILSFNSTFLKVEEIIPRDFLSNTTWAPYGTVQSSYVDDRGVVYGELILPNSTGYWNPPFPEGNGTVATVTFLPIIHETTSFNITINPLFDEFFLNKNGEYMPYLPAKNCHYTYTPLPLPTLSVTPSEYIASHVGELFDIHITLNNLDEQWKLNYTEFTLEFNSNYLKLINVTEGDFLKQFGNTDFNFELGDEYAKINITFTSGEYPYGSGTIATLTFNATTSPGATNLILTNTNLLDFETKEILHQIQNGYYAMHEKLIHQILWNSETYSVITVSNASITPVPMVFSQKHRMLTFNLTGINGTTSFVNITIPQTLLYAPQQDWLVLLNGNVIEVEVTENATHSFVYLPINTDSGVIYIFGTSVIPEMTSTILLITLLATAILILAISKRKK
ncbi:MAG: cohesin domain-containing protein [Candidatus Bathycorpusculaceae bacterium]